MSAKQKIIEFLSGNGEASKGVIDRYMQDEFGTLGGTTERRCRDLVNEGKLEKATRLYEGKPYTTYRIASQPTLL